MKRVLSENLLGTTEVALLFGVHRKTITLWAKAGKIPSTRTPGGTYRYPEAEIRALLNRPSVGPVARDVRAGEWVVIDGDKVKVADVAVVLVLESGEEVRFSPSDPITVLRDEPWTPGVGGGQ